MEEKNLELIDLKKKLENNISKTLDIELALDSILDDVLEYINKKIINLDLLTLERKLEDIDKRVTILEITKSDTNSDDTV